MDIITGIAISRADAAEQIRECFCSFALWGLAAVALYYAIRFVIRGIISARPVTRKHRLASIAMVIGCSILAQKVMVGSVSYPYTDVERKYFLDRGSFVTNDYVHVNFQAIGVPSSADFQGWARPVGSTNDDEWVKFFASTVGQITCPTNIPFVGAISNDFQFFSTWVEAPTVHTNGVLNVKWGVPFTNRADVVIGLPIQTEIRIDNAAIATPASIYTNDTEFLNLNNLNLLMELYDEEN